MANPKGPTTSDFAENPSLCGEEYVWTQMAAAGPAAADGTPPPPVDTKTKVRDFAAHVLGKIMPTDMGPTNELLETLAGTVSAGANPAVAVRFVGQPTVLIGNPDPLRVAGTVELTNPPAFPASMAVTGSVGVAGTVAVVNDAAHAVPVSIGATVVVRFDAAPTVKLDGSTVTVQFAATPTVKLDAASVVSLAPGTSLASAAQRATLAGVVYSACTPPVALTNQAAMIAAIVNPAGSGRMVFLRMFNVSAEIAIVCNRYRVAGAPTGGALVAPLSVGGGSAPSVAKVYSKPTGLSGSDATREWYGASDSTAPDEALAVAPGQTLLFEVYTRVTLATILTGTGNVAVPIRWWDVPIP